MRKSKRKRVLVAIGALISTLIFIGLCGFTLLFMSLFGKSLLTPVCCAPEPTSTPAPARPPAVTGAAATASPEEPATPAAGIPPSSTNTTPAQPVETPGAALTAAPPPVANVAAITFLDMQTDSFIFLDPSSGAEIATLPDPDASLYARYAVSPRGVTFEVDGKLHLIAPDADAPQLISPPPADGRLNDAMLSPEVGRIAWLFERDLPCSEFPCPLEFTLILTDADGGSPLTLWQHRGDDGDVLHRVVLLGWREDGGMLYLARPPEMMASAYFQITPGVLGVGVPDGREQGLGSEDLFQIGESAVSPDGRWLVEAVSDADVNPPQIGILFTDTTTGESSFLTASPGASLVGDIHFASDGSALVWTEASTTVLEGSWAFTTRLYHPGAGEEPLTLLVWAGAAGDTYPHALGWLGADTVLLEKGDGVYAQNLNTEVETLLARGLLFVGVIPAASISQSAPAPFDETAFWEAFPLPDDADLVPVVEGIDLGFATGLTESQVLDFYADWLRNRGWQQQTPTEGMSDLSHQVWRKGEAELRIEFQGMDERGRLVVWLQAVQQLE